MYIFKLLFQFIISLAALRTISGEERFNKLMKTIIYSKGLKYFQYTMLITFVFLGLLMGFLAGTLKVLDGQVITGIVVFLLMAIATLAFTFASYKLEQ